jgi:ABC-type nitrate/sulfonate/bicarbonate transport system permease component
MSEQLKLMRAFRVVVFFVCMAALWEGLVRFLRVPDWLVPAPSQIALLILEKNTVMRFHTMVTMQETAIGFALRWWPASSSGSGPSIFPSGATRSIP